MEIYRTIHKIQMFSILPTFILIICILQCIHCQSTTTNSQIQAQQQKRREAVGMTYINYHLYPFAIASNSQQFIISFHHQEQVKGEIMVHWIDHQKNQVKYPTYQQSQSVSLKIVDTTTYNTVTHQQFNFEAGIDFIAIPEHTYRIIFTNQGQKVKMIQFSLSYVQPQQIKAMTNTTNIMVQASQKTKKILQEVSHVLGQSEQSLVFGRTLHEEIKNNIYKYLLGCIWEIVLIGSLIGTQYYLFQKYLGNQSIL